MATQPIKTRFELDGEKEYKAAVSEINASLRVLNSEMKLVSAQFATNADSVDALTARSDVLTRQILTQKEKVEALQAALKDSADRYGEADDRTKRWQITLNNAEADIRNALTSDPRNGYLYLLRAKLNKLRFETDAAQRDVKLAQEYGVDDAVVKAFLGLED